MRKIEIMGLDCSSSYMEWEYNLLEAWEWGQLDSSLEAKVGEIVHNLDTQAMIDLFKSWAIGNVIPTSGEGWSLI